MSSNLSEEIARRLRPDGAFHLPPPAQPINSTVELVVESAPSMPTVVLTDNHRGITWQVLMTADGDTWRTNILLPQEPTLVKYHFTFADGSTLRETRQVEGETKPVYGEWVELDYKIAVYNPARMPAAWTQGMVIYQIFPDRFANSDHAINRTSPGVYGHPPLYKSWDDLPESPPLGRDFFGGDLRGIIDKLDYLAELGIECIYTCPIFKATSNHRYDTIDYYKIDPMLGSNDDLKELVEQAHARGIRVVLDVVYNHCSADSVYFDTPGRYEKAGAARSKHSPYYRFFTFKSHPNEYTGWAGYSHMPQFSEAPEVEKFFFGENSVTTFWLSMGVDGFRTDVTFDKSDEFWRRFRKRVDATKPDAYLISEEWRDATHYMLGDTFNGTMNYRFAWAVRGFLAYDTLTPSLLDDRLAILRRDTPPPALLSQMNLVGSHDTDRVLSTAKNDPRRLRQIVAFMLAYPGAPMIYYGDETGLQGVNAEDARRTMPWDALDDELGTTYREAIAFRKTSTALRTGDFKTLVVDDDARVYAFQRQSGDDIVIAVFNGGDAPAEVTVPAADGTWHDLFGGHAEATASDGAFIVTLTARGAAWYAQG